jgi:3-hydroxyacyl-CoA dehydrogenase
VLDAAVAFANEIADVRPLPRVRDWRVEHPNAEGFLDFARNAVVARNPRFPAPRKLRRRRRRSPQPNRSTKAWPSNAKLSPPWSNRANRGAAPRLLRRARREQDRRRRPEDTALAIASRGVIGAGTMGGGIT